MLSLVMGAFGIMLVAGKLPVRGSGPPPPRPSFLIADLHTWVRVAAADQLVCDSRWCQRKLRGLQPRLHGVSSQRAGRCQWLETVQLAAFVVPSLTASLIISTSDRLELIALLSGRRMF